MLGSDLYYVRKWPALCWEVTCIMRGGKWPALCWEVTSIMLGSDFCIMLGSDLHYVGKWPALCWEVTCITLRWEVTCIMLGSDLHYVGKDSLQPLSSANMWETGVERVQFSRSHVLFRARQFTDCVRGGAEWYEIDFVSHFVRFHSRFHTSISRPGAIFHFVSFPPKIKIFV